MSVTYVRYVAHHKVHDFERAGWIRTSALKDTHHGVHAMLMKWGGNGEPPEEEEAGENRPEVCQSSLE